MVNSRPPATSGRTHRRFVSLRMVWLPLILSLVGGIAACGGDDSSGGTDSPAPQETSSDGAAPPSGVEPAAAEDDGGAGEGVGSVVVVIGGETYEASVRDDIVIRGPGGEDLGNFPTRCDPTFFGGYWVIGVAVDESGERLDPGFNVEAELWPADAEQDTDFRVSDDIRHVDWRLTGDPGDWTVNGTRASGQVELKSDASPGEVVTATFEFSCPDG
jgi:hypothetical protein